MQLPPLPRIDEREKFGQIFRGPTESSNWVIPGMLMCGPYPGAFEDKKNDQFLKRILSKGIDTFVCLQEELNNEIPEHVWRSGVGLRPYFFDAERLSKKPLRWVQLPIPDGLVAPDDVTADLVHLICEDMKAGRVVYLHCFGGHGRAGVFSSLILSYLYRLTATEAMRRVQAYHDCRMVPQRAKSPQTVVQRDQVKRQVEAILQSEAPEIKIVQDLARVEVDAGRRGGMMPPKKASQTASCPQIGSASGTPTRGGSSTGTPKRQPIHGHRAMPDYLALPNIPSGRTAKFRRDEIMRQKAMAAASRRKPNARSTASVECLAEWAMPEIPRAVACF